jgi:hypothetical protein
MIFWWWFMQPSESFKTVFPVVTPVGPVVWITIRNPVFIKTGFIPLMLENREPQPGESVNRNFGRSILLLFILAPGLVSGCPVPVFQYALEFWEADPYYFTVYYRDTLTAEEQQAVEYLKETGRPGGIRANVQLELIDLAAARVPALPESLPDGQGAWLVVRYPGRMGPGEMCWEGRLTLNQARMWCESPLRREVGARLLARESAAWIFLRSGHARKDRAAERRLREELQRLERTLVLPALEDWAWGDPKETDLAPAKVRFSIFSLDRNDPEEEMLIHMLLGSEADLVKFEEEPMAFPVFGQGRVLYALMGEGINEWTVGKAAEFLTGACSCQVKALNPGTDLLMAVDWESNVRKLSAGGLPPPIGLAAFPDRIRAAEELIQAGGADPHRVSAAEADGEEVSPKTGAVQADESSGSGVEEEETVAARFFGWAGAAPLVSLSGLAALALVSILIFRNKNHLR